MFSASQCGVRTPLSPLTQTTLEKHLPGLPKRRFLQQNQVQKCDVGCITGMCVCVKLYLVVVIRCDIKRITDKKIL